MQTLLLSLGIALLAALPARAGWLDDLLDKARGLTATPAASQAVATLSDEEVMRGLKEALSQGANQAVGRLGRAGGFLDDPAVRIPLPENLQRAESLLRRVGQDRLADEFVTTLNRAAEQAVPEGTAVLADTIAGMTLADARAILNGTDDATTQYFRKHGEAQLKERFLPIVRQATEQAGVTSAYKGLVQALGPYAQLLGGADLDGHVADKALDGLFLAIAEEERRIRQDPMARGTELLRKVFGSVVR